MTTFHHVESIGHKHRISSLEDNIKDFIDWSFLHIGGFINVSGTTSGLYGSNFNTLKPVNEPSQTSRVWEAPRKDWVYESGVTYKNISPLSISGIYVNNTFLPSPTGSGNYGYNINYPLGRIEFNNNISSTSNITLNYSYRYVQVYKANDSAWWKEIQSETYNPANIKTSGDYAITANHRVQMPMVMIETIPRTVLTPRELGNTDNIIIQDLLLHVFSENINQRNSLVDILVLQKDKTISLYNYNNVVKDGVYALNKNGSINPTGLNYDQLSENYRRHWCTIKNSSISELNTYTTSLYNGIVRWSVEIFP